MSKLKQLVWREPDSHPDPQAPEPISDHIVIMKCRFKKGGFLLVGFDGQNLKTHSLGRSSHIWPGMYRCVADVSVCAMEGGIGLSLHFAVFSWCLCICYYFPNTNFLRQDSIVQDFILPLASNPGLVI